MKKFRPCISLLMFSASSVLFANPQGFKAIMGDAVVSYPEASTVEVVTGKQAVINWKSFSIEESETTRFVMPSSSASVLNRVLGGDLSKILGTLEANGQVFLINANGVIVGENAIVDTGSFIASSFDILDSEFMKGGDLAFKGLGGSVINLGQITARSGDVILAGHQVSNEGRIDALACGVSSGRIFLLADQGSVETSGSLIAPSGEIRILGNEVAVLSRAHINVSGENGGGVVLIGGDYKGSNPEIPNASYVRIELDAFIEADGLDQGSGGRVIVWGDHQNSFFGTISACGGENGGHGGFVEISSHGLIVPVGEVFTLAANGNAGTLLLDPSSVSISTLPDVNIVMGSAPDYMFDMGATSNINVANLEGFLTSNNVVIDASSGGGTASFGSISVDASFNWFTSNSLTLIANDDSMNSQIAFNANIQAPLGSLIVNGGNVVVGDAMGNATSSITIDVNDLQVQIDTGNNLNLYGSSASGTSAEFKIKTGNITVGSTSNLNLIGGQGNSSYAAINVNGGSLNINGCAGNVNLYAGDGSQSSASISAVNGNISLLCMTDLNVFGSDIGDYSQAFISTKGSGDINISVTGKIELHAGAGAQSDASVFTNGINGSIDIHTDADLFLAGGTILSLPAPPPPGPPPPPPPPPTPPLTGGAASIATTSSLSPITITANGVVDLLAGNTPNSSAQIKATGSSLSITAIGNVFMTSTTALTALNAYTLIAAAGDVTIDCNDLVLEGGFAPNAYSRILTTGGGDINIMHGSGMMQTPIASLVVQAGSSADASLFTRFGGDININAESVDLLAGIGTTSTVNIIAGTDSSGGDISVLAGELSCVGNSNAQITIMTGQSGPGSILLQTTTPDTMFNDSMFLTNTVLATQYLYGSDNPISVFSAGTLGVSDSNISTFLGQVSTSSFASTNLTNTTITPRVPVNGFVTMVAGIDMVIDTTSSINVLGQLPSVVLVVDNDSPMSVGAGEFNYATGARIDVSGQGFVRIYTADRSQNTIGMGAVINGLTYVAHSPEFDDTNQEVWGIYYPTVPMAPQDGSDHFTIYYKNDFIP